MKVSIIKWYRTEKYLNQKGPIIPVSYALAAPEKDQTRVQQEEEVQGRGDRDPFPFSSH